MAFDPKARNSYVVKTGDGRCDRASNAGPPGKRDKNGSIPTASRAYFEEFGDRCVEADAISPIEIRRRCEEAIRRHIDQARWEARLEIEAREKVEVRSLIARKPRENGRTPI